MRCKAEPSIRAGQGAAGDVKEREAAESTMASSLRRYPGNPMLCRSCYAAFKATDAQRAAEGRCGGTWKWKRRRKEARGTSRGVKGGGRCRRCHRRARQGGCVQFDDRRPPRVRRADLLLCMCHGERDVHSRQPTLSLQRRIAAI